MVGTHILDNRIRNLTKDVMENPKYFVFLPVALPFLASRMMILKKEDCSSSKWAARKEKTHVNSGETVVVSTISLKITICNGGWDTQVTLKEDLLSCQSNFGYQNYWGNAFGTADSKVLLQYPKTDVDWQNFLFFFWSEHKHESQTFLNDPGFLKISLYHICFD